MITSQLILSSPESIVEVKRKSNWEYTILNKISSTQGMVFVTRRQLRDFREGSLLYNALRTDFSDKEFVLDIDLFAPHGYEEPALSFLRIGIGNYVLKRVLEDMNKDKIKIAYSHEPAPNFYSLLMKTGFVELNDGRQREVFKRFLIQAEPKNAS